MNSLKLIAPIKYIGATEKVVSKTTAKEFYFRHLVLDLSEVNQSTGQIFEKFAAIQFSGDKCQLLDNFAIGTVVQVSFNIRSRSFAKKEGNGTTWMTSADGYKIEAYNQNPNMQPQQQQFQQQQPMQGYQQQGNAQNPTGYQQPPIAGYQNAPAQIYQQPQTNMQQGYNPPPQNNAAQPSTVPSQQGANPDDLPF